MFTFAGRPMFNPCAESFIPWGVAAVLCLFVSGTLLADTPPKEELPCPESAETVLELAAMEQHEAAVALFERVKEVCPEAIEAIHGHKVAIVYAHIGDRARHEAHCRWLMDRYQDSELPTDAERSVKGYLVFPSAEDPALLAHALERTRLAVTNSEERGEYQWIHWFWGSLGIAEYRSDNFAEAVAWLEKAAASDNLYITSLVLPFQAMAEFARGNQPAAEALLEQARDTAARLPEPGTEEYLKEWTDTLTTQLAMGEAESVIAGNPGASTPR